MSINLKFSKNVKNSFSKLKAANTHNSRIYTQNAFYKINKKYHTWKEHHKYILRNIFKQFFLSYPISVKIKKKKSNIAYIVYTIFI